MASRMGALPKALQTLQSCRLADPHRLWAQAHLSRRAGVLLLLSPAAHSADPNDVEVLLTVRSQQLLYAGDAALPGGKADTLAESPWDVAVREAEEEVAVRAAQFTFVRTMPAYVSSRLLMVVPSVAWAPQPISSAGASAGEVAKVFSASLRRFLHSDRTTDAPIPGGSVKLHHFDLPAAADLSGAGPAPGAPKYDRVWGLTANILIDCARLCFGEQPDFDFYRGVTRFAAPGSLPGNMDVLESMLERGTLQKQVPKRRR